MLAYSCTLSTSVSHELDANTANPWVGDCALCIKKNESDGFEVQQTEFEDVFALIRI